MIHSSKAIAIMLLVATFLSASSGPVIAQDARDKPKSNWPTESKSVVKKTTEGLTAVTLSDEPVMRIALSTGTSAATISTTARLLNVSEIDSINQPLETTRVRVESRMLTPSQVSNDRSYEMILATSLSREDADRLSDAVRQNADEQPQVTADSGNKWKVIIQKQTKPELEEVRTKLDDAGFEVVAVKETQKQLPNTTAAKSSTENRSPTLTSYWRTTSAFPTVRATASLSLAAQHRCFDPAPR